MVLLSFEILSCEHTDDLQISRVHQRAGFELELVLIHKIADIVLELDLVGAAFQDDRALADDAAQGLAGDRAGTRAW